MVIHRASSREPCASHIDPDAGQFLIGVDATRIKEERIGVATRSVAPTTPSGIGAHPTFALHRWEICDWEELEGICESGVARERSRKKSHSTERSLLPSLDWCVPYPTIDWT
jgi:hypothetical protein